MTAAALLALALSTAADEQSTWQPFFTAHVENDSAPGAGTDESYTQGLDIHVTRDGEWKWLSPAVSKLWNVLPGGRPADDPAENVQSFVLGQTILTPRNLITYFPSKADRPFAAFLFTGAEASRVRNTQVDSPSSSTEKWRLMPARLTLGVYGGMIGPSALGRDTQSGWHVLRQNRLVKGWSVDQLGNEPQLNLRLAYDHIPLRKAGWADLTLSSETSLGTTQTYAGAGATVRLGYGLSTFPGTTIAYSAVPPASGRFEFGLQGGVRARYMARNAFIEGTFSDPTTLTLERALTEVSVGFETRWQHWRLTYLIVDRSREFSPRPAEMSERHRFAALNLSREPWDGSGDRWLPAWLTNGTRLNLRFGRGRSDTTPERPVDPRVSLAAAQGLEHAFRIGKARFSAAYEQSGVGREEGPPAGRPIHTDLFLTSHALVVGFEPLPATSRHSIQLRGGGGRASIKLQTTPDTRTIIEPETDEATEGGRSLTGGLRYALRLGRPLSLVVDVTSTRLTSDTAVIRKATSTAATFGVQIHPWGREAGR